MLTTTGTGLLPKGRRITLFERARKRIGTLGQLSGAAGKIGLLLTLELVRHFVQHRCDLPGLFRCGVFLAFKQTFRLPTYRLAKLSTSLLRLLADLLAIKAMLATATSACFRFCTAVRTFTMGNVVHLPPPCSAKERIKWYAANTSSVHPLKKRAHIRKIVLPEGLSMRFGEWCAQRYRKEISGQERLPFAAKSR